MSNLASLQRTIHGMDEELIHLLQRRQELMTQVKKEYGISLELPLEKMLSMITIHGDEKDPITSPTLEKKKAIPERPMLYSRAAQAEDTIVTILGKE